jgi:hypothetical protein
VRQFHARHLVGAIAEPQRAIFVALSFAHDERESVEIDILHAQAQRLVDPHSGSVQQLSQQAVLALHPRKHGSDFFNREDDWQALRPFGSRHIVQPRQFHLQHGAVKEEQGGQRLVVRGGGDRPPVGEHRKVGLDLHCRHFARMPPAVKADEIARPVDVGAFGS